MFIVRQKTEMRQGRTYPCGRQLVVFGDCGEIVEVPWLDAWAHQDEVLVPVPSGFHYRGAYTTGEGEKRLVFEGPSALELASPASADPFPGPSLSEVSQELHDALQLLDTRVRTLEEESPAVAARIEATEQRIQRASEIVRTLRAAQPTPAIRAESVPSVQQSACSSSTVGAAVQPPARASAPSPQAQRPASERPGQAPRGPAR